MCVLGADPRPSARATSTLNYWAPWTSRAVWNTSKSLPLWNNNPERVFTCQIKWQHSYLDSRTGVPMSQSGEEVLERESTNANKEEQMWLVDTKLASLLGNHWQAFQSLCSGGRGRGGGPLWVLGQSELHSNVLSPKIIFKNLRQEQGYRTME